MSSAIFVDSATAGDDDDDDDDDYPDDPDYRGDDGDDEDGDKMHFCPISSPSKNLRLKHGE